MAKTCDYFFTPQSPWAYLGHERFAALAKQYGVQISIKPCDMGKVFSVSGGLPLAKRAPQRQAYRLVELKRWSEHLGMPLNLQPKFFPVSGDAAAKLIIAARIAHGTEAAMRLTGAIMRAVWAEEKNIADAGCLAGLATDAGLDGKVLLQSADTAAVQQEYDRNTDEAIAANVFGAPWYVVGGEGFWGQDRLDFVERAFGKL
ncbi:2-hydroxychromene-2-carboxylate isomerase [Noviherbaspirillum humi]|uniref:2-hydroxychromene-2-carboxylate isomerase n=1 Tax=Noviherbaspirillum humi TaxID=1688639 RepID=A0A239E7R3_9BURK|nr:2-hydroxychromene-2-carboxylate isomerase [Noviherbaspirillum humi]SNS39924.1 2-hydroxychromene-2-carboxylate isomerase [Noviherbaspirillum humi]